MSTFMHNLMARYADCMTDLTQFEEVPPGWQALIALLVRDLAEALAAFPGHVIAIRQVKEKFGTLRVYVGYGDGELGPTVYSVLHPIIVAAEAKSGGTCQVCGRPGRLHRGPGLWATLCDGHTQRPALSDGSETASAGDRDSGPEEHGVASDWAAAVAREPMRDAAPRGAFKLYSLRAVADALGQPANLPEDELVPNKTETEHEARLAALLERGEAGTWRDLARPNTDMLAQLDYLDRLAPHLADVTALVRRHVKAALTVGLPVNLPAVALIGEAGVGKSWYLSRLGAALGVPTRTYPMSAATLGDGLQGSHKSWRNAGPGLIAKTLLQENIANPLILIDEFDKGAPGSWSVDPYRPFYILLEPGSAKYMHDEYLGFDLDASRVLWVIAGNSLQPVPSIIRDRLTVIQVPALTRDHLAAVAHSIYADANTQMLAFFEPDLAPTVLDGLLDLTPRVIRRTVLDALVRAAAEGRRVLRPSDLEAPRQGQAEQMGFVMRRPRRPVR